MDKKYFQEQIMYLETLRQEQETRLKNAKIEVRAAQDSLFVIQGGLQVYNNLLNQSIKGE
jgi:hypothetical protein